MVSIIGMNRRDRLAWVTAVALAILCGFFATFLGEVGLCVMLIGAFVGPVLVGILARRRIFTIALLHNAVMCFTYLMTGSVLTGRSQFEELGVLLFLLLGLSAVPALVVAAIVSLLRAFPRSAH
jgi:hypothetical protein